ncbi:MAG TPA: hypothetical protein VM577_11595 [Anaerovoracaceae bacterium]|nr:hypothetical protein [Anaerovoracaceae bacterium]
MNEYKSRIALVYVLFDRAVNGKTVISTDEFADVLRLAHDHFNPIPTRALPNPHLGYLGEMYEHRLLIGNSIELWIDMGEELQCQD